MSGLFLLEYDRFITYLMMLHWVLNCCTVNKRPAVLSQAKDLRIYPTFIRKQVDEQTEGWTLSLFSFCDADNQLFELGGEESGWSGGADGCSKKSTQLPEHGVGELRWLLGYCTLIFLGFNVAMQKRGRLSHVKTYTPLWPKSVPIDMEELHWSEWQG